MKFLQKQKWPFWRERRKREKYCKASFVFLPLGNTLLFVPLALYKLLRIPPVHIIISSLPISQLVLEDNKQRATFKKKKKKKKKNWWPKKRSEEKRTCWSRCDKQLWDWNKEKLRKKKRLRFSSLSLGSPFLQCVSMVSKSFFELIVERRLTKLLGLWIRLFHLK